MGDSEQEILYEVSDEVKKSLIELKINDAEELDNSVDKICVKAGFRVSKSRGGKTYIYYSCHYGGRVREKTDSEKERNKK